MLAHLNPALPILWKMRVAGLGMTKVSPLLWRYFCEIMESKEINPWVIQTQPCLDSAYAKMEAKSWGLLNLDRIRRIWNIKDRNTTVNSCGEHHDNNIHAENELNTHCQQVHCPIHYWEPSKRVRFCKVAHQGDLFNLLEFKEYKEIHKDVCITLPIHLIKITS